MTNLYQQWRDIAEAERTQEAGEKFWNDYFEAETENYKKLLADHKKVYSGKISELAPMFNMDEPTFVGFIDGINTSLKTEIDLDTLESDSVVTLDIDFEKLYYNMHEAKASWLYELKEWDKVLSEAKRHEITKQYRASKVFIKENTVRRNDPCPCGSGKKYKKCCMQKDKEAEMQQ